MDDRNRDWGRSEFRRRGTFALEKETAEIQYSSAGIPYVHKATTGPLAWFSPLPSVNPHPPSSKTHTLSFTLLFILDNEVRPKDNRTSRLWSLFDPFRPQSWCLTHHSSTTDRPLQRMEAILPRLCRPQTNPKGRVPQLNLRRFDSHLTH